MVNWQQCSPQVADGLMIDAHGLIHLVSFTTQQKLSDGTWTHSLGTAGLKRCLFYADWFTFLDIHLSPKVSNNQSFAVPKAMNTRAGHNGRVALAHQTTHHPDDCISAWLQNMCGMKLVLGQCCIFAMWKYPRLTAPDQQRLANYIVSQSMEKEEEFIMSQISPHPSLRCIAHQCFFHGACLLGLVPPWLVPLTLWK